MNAANHFAETYGRPPEGCWAAPGRVNVIGEYTDLNDGFVLPIAIPKVTVVAAARRSDRRLVVRSVQAGDAAGLVDLDLGSTGSPKGWAAYPLAVAQALLAAGHAIHGADLLIESEVPIGAGLSSSAALECSVAVALCALFGIELSPMEIALIAQRAENDFVGVPCGIMDQAASMCCRPGYALFLDTRTLVPQQVPFDLPVAGLALIVIDTQVKHDLIGSAYAERRSSCLEAARLLGVPALRDVPSDEAEGALERLAELGDEVLVRRARHVLSEQARVLEVVRRLEAGQPETIGELLSASHRSLRDDFEVSSPELDTVVDVANAAGALGARLTGAGFGGSAIALVAEGDVVAVETLVNEGLAERGFGAATCFTVVASAGAHEVTTH
jgi:galactokinase